MSQAAQRPAGITVLAVLHFVIAGLMLLSGLLWLLFLRLMGSRADIGIGAEVPIDVSDEIILLLKMGRGAVVLFWVYGALKAVSGYGLLKLRNWGRWLTIALAGVTILLSLWGVAAALRDRDLAGAALNFIFAGGYAAIIGYLFTSRVKQAFGGSKAHRSAL